MNGGLWPLERQASEEDYPGLSLQKGKLRLKIRQEVSGQVAVRLPASRLVPWSVSKALSWALLRGILLSVLLGLRGV